MNNNTITNSAGRTVPLIQLQIGQTIIGNTKKEYKIVDRYSNGVCLGSETNWQDDVKLSFLIADNKITIKN